MCEQDLKALLPLDLHHPRASTGLQQSLIPWEAPGCAQGFPGLCLSCCLGNELLEIQISGSSWKNWSGRKTLGSNALHPTGSYPTSSSLYPIFSLKTKQINKRNQFHPALIFMKAPALLNIEILSREGSGILLPPASHCPEHSAAESIPLTTASY